MKATLACALMVGATALAGASAPAEDRGPTTISEIRHESSERSTRIAVECTGPVAYTYYSPDPLTLVVDIPEVDSSSVPSRINVATREVESDPGDRQRARRRAQPRPPRDPPGQPRALPDLLEGQDAEPGVRARPRGRGRRRPPQRGRGGRRRAARRVEAPAPAAARAGRGPPPAAATVIAPRRPPAREARVAHPRPSTPGDEDGQFARHRQGRRRAAVPGLLPRQPRPPRPRLQGRHQQGDAPGRGEPRARARGAPRPVQHRRRRASRAWCSTSRAARPTASSRAPTA